MKIIRKFLLLSLFLTPLFLSAQFPTAVGTYWQYFQYRDDQPTSSMSIPAFRDEVVADTTIDGNTWQKVNRSGILTTTPLGSGVYYYDTLDGIWFYRVQGDTVWALDSVVAGSAIASILYDFSQNTGDTISYVPVGLVEQTRFNTNYSARYLCSQGQTNYCSDPYVVDTAQSLGAGWDVAGFSYAQTYNQTWQNDIGMVRAQPFIWALGISMNHYFLGELISNGQTLYENDSLMLGRIIVCPGPWNQADIYPNPTSEQLNIFVDNDPQQIRISDLQGRVLFMDKPEGMKSVRYEIPVSDWEAGVYLVDILRRTGLVRKKIVVQ